MEKINKPIENITPDSFKEFGVVLDFSPEFPAEFEILVREADHPWRMAVYRPSKRVCKFLENHPGSIESFEPVRGTSLILVAANADPEGFRIFLLDKPVCLGKGVWHNVIPLSDDVLIRVNENLEVAAEFHKFENGLEIRCVWA